MLRKIRYTLLPPGSRQELLLRTLHYRLIANRFIVNQQIKKARNSYHRYKAQQDHAPFPPAPGAHAQPTVTFLLAIRNGAERLAEETLKSIRDLASPNWEVVPVLDESLSSTGWLTENLTDPRIKPALRLNDIRLKKWITVRNGASVFCNSGDIFHKSLLNHYYAVLSRGENPDIVFFDCEYQDPVSGTRPFFKPAVLTPDLLVSINYLSRALIRNSSISAFSFESRSTDDLLALEYALVLQLSKRKCSVQHIPGILVSLQDKDATLVESLLTVLKNHFTELGFKQVNVKKQGVGRQINWQHHNPSAAIIILNQNHGGWLRTLIHSIKTKTEYPDYSIVIVDNQSTEQNVLNYYQELATDQQVKVVHYDQEFNYSTAINTGVANTQAEVIVLLNNDMLVIEPDWLNELVKWASHPEIGVVGARLLHRNRSIQHAGIILGMNKYVGHLYLNAPEDYFGLAGSTMWYRNFHALTGACQAVRREVFQQLGGYDERYHLAFGDINFCLKAEQKGYRNLYNPYATLIHYEGGSRGIETPVQDILLGYEEILRDVQNGDPFFASHLSYTNIPSCLTKTEIDNLKPPMTSGLKTYVTDHN